MTRVNLIKGVGPVLQIAEGWSVELPEHVHDILNKRTDSTWPTTWFAPRLTGKGPFSDVYSVMANWGANHGVLTVGHVGADFITLASMLRIPVCMHNVPEALIYRPTAWALTVWIRKGRITAPVKITDRYTNIKLACQPAPAGWQPVGTAMKNVFWFSIVARRTCAPLRWIPKGILWRAPRWRTKAKAPLKIWPGTSGRSTPSCTVLPSVVRKSAQR